MKIDIPQNQILLRKNIDPIEKVRLVITCRSVEEIANYIEETERETLNDKIEIILNKHSNK